MINAPLRLSMLAALMALTTACGKAPSPADAGTGPAAAASGDPLADSAATAAADLAATAPDPEDPCRLLEPAEVEAVLGAPLAGAPFRTGNPNGDSGGLPDETGD